MSILTGPRAFKLELPETKSFEMQGTVWRVLASGDSTGGLVGALDERCAHGVAAPMHTHEREDEVFYVIDGSITFFVGTQSIPTTAGTFIYLPKYVPHGFRVDSSEARVFNFVTPAGFEKAVLDNGRSCRYDHLPEQMKQDPSHKPTQNQVDAMLEKYGVRIDLGDIPPHALP